MHVGLIHAEHAGAECGKFETLLPMLEELGEEGHKAVVFSQFTAFLGLLEPELAARGIAYEYLDGTTNDRQARVDQFQADPDCRVFLISLKAGGVGLNLTEADYVFLLDPWWNPAVETQAIDRTHRIGQTSNVFAYRLIAKDTVEERVAELQAEKRAFDGVGYPRSSTKGTSGAAVGGTANWKAVNWRPRLVLPPSLPGIQCVKVGLCQRVLSNSLPRSERIGGQRDKSVHLTACELARRVIVGLMPGLLELLEGVCDGLEVRRDTGGAKGRIQVVWQGRSKCLRCRFHVGVTNARVVNCRTPSRLCPVTTVVEASSTNR